MLKNPKFDSFRKSIFSITICILVTSNVAAATIQGKFFNEQAYSGEYSVSEVNNPNGLRVNPVAVKLAVDREKNIVSYTYIAEDIPSVKASDMGFLSIVVNSGGMEGSVTYNYVVPNHGALLSIGTVRTTLHLGKIESIDVQQNKNLTKNEINDFVRKIVRFNPLALSQPFNAYPAATLLLLGQGKFLTSEDDSTLSALLGNTEISDDPVLLRAIKNVIYHDAYVNKKTQTSNKKTVVHNKAYFFNYPALPGITKSYLIKGDSVVLIKESDDGKYWLSDYISAHGIRTEKWVRCEDIGYCR